MYLGKNKISLLPTFLTGYHFGFSNANGEASDIDELFGENGFFGESGFLKWFYKKQNKTPGSFWHGLFFELADNDEVKALDLFFEYLEKYSNEKVECK